MTPESRSHPHTGPVYSERCRPPKPAFTASVVERGAVGAIVLLVAIRPIIDLGGHFEGETLNPGGAANLLIIALATVALTLHIARGKRWSSPSVVLVLAYVALLVTHAVSTAFSEDQFASLVETTRFMSGFAPVAVVIYAWSTRCPSHRSFVVSAFLLFVASTLVPSLVAWLQLAGFVPFTYFDYLDGVRFGRPSGGYYQPSSYGRIGVFLVAYAVTLRGANLLSGRLTAAVVTMALATTIITTHRTSIVSAAAVLAIGLGGGLLVRQRLRLLPVAFGAVLALAALLGVTGSSTVYERVGSEWDKIVGRVGALDPTSDAFLRNRGEKWSRSIALFDSAPIATRLMGRGYEVFEPHNDLLRMLMVSGIAGAALYVVLLATVAFTTWRRVDANGRIGVLALNTYLILYAIGLQPTSYPNFMSLFFLGHALVATIHRKTH
jgi:O-antigen ligase